MEYKLIKNMLEKSEANIWVDAKKEWIIKKVYFLERGYDTCCCGHFPIKQVIIIFNKLNKNQLIVGNCCINKIFTAEYNKFFTSVKRDRLNEMLISMAYDDGIISGHQHVFLMNNRRKRSKPYSYKFLKDKILKHFKQK